MIDFQDEYAIKKVVGWYDNHGKLNQVAEMSGVSLIILSHWINDVRAISEDNLQKLRDCMNKRTVGESK
jgi:hypothetical protein